MSEERFSKAAPLPNRLHRLHELALDLSWSWDDRARQLFRQLDYQSWRATAHNPAEAHVGALHDHAARAGGTGGQIVTACRQRQQYFRPA